VAAPEPEAAPAPLVAEESTEETASDTGSGEGS
jgi:hypothetical protein